MYTAISNNKLFIILALVLSFGVFSSAYAQEKKEDEIKTFLKESEFGLQRKIAKESALGKKGLITESEDSNDLSNLVTVDLIDPFQNKTIKGTQTDLSPLDDGIDLDLDDAKFADDLASFRAKIDEYFEKIESQEDIDPVELLNNLKINRIVSSPVKYVEIHKKKYIEGDIIKVRVNRFAKQDEFESMLDSVNVRTKNSEEAELLEELKQESLDRFNSLTENPETALNIVKVEINKVGKAQVSFLIDEKSYKVIMKR